MIDQRIIGTLRSESGAGTVRMQDQFATNASDLWDAITDPGRLARWVATVEGELQLHGSFHAHFTSGWDGPGRVDVCDPPNRLMLTMSPGQKDGTVIEAVLTADGEETLLVIEERGLPLAEYADHGAGWQAHVEDLAAHLGGRQPSDWHTRWTELIPDYRALAAAVS